MSKLNSFLATLMPSFTKDVLDEEYEDVQKQVNNVNIPLFEKAMKEVGLEDFTSSMAADMHETLYRNIKLKEKTKGGVRHRNFIGGFLQISKTMQKQLPLIENVIQKHFEQDISTFAMNAPRINVLQYVPVMGFVCRYMRRFFDYAVSLEINVKSESSEPVFDLIPADRTWLSDYRNAFIDSVVIILRFGDDSLERVFDELPEVAIDPTNAKVVESTKGNVVDPMGLGFIPISVNPIFHARRFVMNLQVERYHLAVDEYQMLQKKVYNLKIINEGRNDPKLQREIRYTEENRIRPLKQKIEKWEKEYVGNNP